MEAVARLGAEMDSESEKGQAGSAKGSMQGRTQCRIQEGYAAARLPNGVAGMPSLFHIGESWASAGGLEDVRTRRMLVHA